MTADVRYIAIEGCIGVGKTTLTHLLAGALGGRTVLEVVEENPFLPDFYRDQVAHAFKTQMFFLLSRFKQQEALLQPELFARTVVTDYIFAKDRIFAELTLSASERALYDQVFRALSSKVRAPDLVIHLHAPMDAILARIAKRGRSFEQDIDRAYLERLVDAYARFFSAYDEAPVLGVDTTSLDFPGKPEDFERLVGEIERFVAAGASRSFLAGNDGRQPPLL